ncbi:MAG: hypothetical protein ABJA86_09875, partial [Nocardioidaceae bacterium]
MRVGRHITGTGLAFAAVAALLLSGCGGGDSSSSDGTSPSESTSSSASQGTPVTAVEKEFSITLSPSTFSPGTYTFNVENQGSFAHNLTIKGPGVDSQATPTINGGESAQLTVTLQKGSYELWCSVDSHKDQGMD